MSAQARERLLGALASGATAVILTTADGCHSVRAAVDVPRPGTPPTCCYGRLTVDWSEGAVATSTGRTLLSKTELRLLGALLADRREPMTAEELSRRVWPDAPTDARGCAALPIYVCSLRRRLASIGAGSALRIGPGFSYRLDL